MNLDDLTSFLAMNIQKPLAKRKKYACLLPTNFRHDLRPATGENIARYTHPHEGGNSIILLIFMCHIHKAFLGKKKTFSFVAFCGHVVNLYFSCIYFLRCGIMNIRILQDTVINRQSAAYLIFFWFSVVKRKSREKVNLSERSNKTLT